MARAKRTSSVLEAANRRLAGLNSIKDTPNLGPNLSVAAYGQEITVCTTLLNSYNQILSTADQMQHDLEAAEKNLGTTNKRILAGVGAQFGPDSNEYEQVGRHSPKRAQTPDQENPAQGLRHNLTACGP